MTKRILLLAVLLAAPVAASAPAYAIVPGSDTATRAQDAAAVQSVIESRTSGSTARAFGFPVAPAARSGGLVPGSDHFHYADETRDLDRVIRSQPSTGMVPVPGGLVPGSDAF